MKLTCKVIVDDYQGRHESDHETIGDAAEMIYALERDGYDVFDAQIDGLPVERYQTVPTNTGWQHCNACGGYHPLRSEC